jgi:hypothetical protein
MLLFFGSGNSEGGPHYELYYYFYFIDTQSVKMASLWRISCMHKITRMLY